jgi:hypothetical protein
VKLDAETLEAAAQMLEHTAGNTLYQAAWRAAAKKIRRMKILNDDGQQISIESARPV